MTPNIPLNTAISRRAKENQERAEREAIRISECKKTVGTDAQKIADAWMKGQANEEN
jgi:hypothetical protein